MNMVWLSKSLNSWKAFTSESLRSDMNATREPDDVLAPNCGARAGFVAYMLRTSREYKA